MQNNIDEYINITPQNIDSEHLCCIIRTRKEHQGIICKKQWLTDRLKEGHIFRKLNCKGTVFIEYSPLKTAWVPIEGDNYMYIYCLWVTGKYKGQGHGKALMQYCIDDAKKNGMSGICMLGAEKQKAWLSDQSFACKFGFEESDRTATGYKLLTLSFDGTYPHFTDRARKSTIESKVLTVYYDMQCPYIQQNIDNIRNFCIDNNIEVSLIFVDSSIKAKSVPGVFNNFAVFYNGHFKTVNIPVDINTLKKILSE